MPEFRCERRCEDTKLLKSLHGYQTACAADCTERLSGTRTGGAGNCIRTDTKICRYTIYDEIVCACPLTADAVLARGNRTGRRDHNPRSELQQRIETPTVQR